MTYFNAEVHLVVRQHKWVRRKFMRRLYVHRSENHKTKDLIKDFCRTRYLLVSLGVPKKGEMAEIQIMLPKYFSDPYTIDKAERLMYYAGLDSLITLDSTLIDKYRSALDNPTSPYLSQTLRYISDNEGIPDWQFVRLALANGFKVKAQSPHEEAEVVLGEENQLVYHTGKDGVIPIRESWSTHNLYLE